MAAEDFAAQGGGFKVEILSADHQNKPDVGAQIVREWVDRDGVDAVADAVNSGVGLAVNTVMAEKHRTFIATNVGTSDLTGKFCEPTTVQWTMDTYAMGNTMARAMMAQHADTWYYISFDYALGAALERDSVGRAHQSRRQGSGICQASARDDGFFLISVAGAGFGCQGRCAGRYRHVT